MPLIPLQGNAIVQVTFRSTLAGQRVLNQFRYHLLTPAPVDYDYRQAMNDLEGKFTETGGLRDKYIAACPTNQQIADYTLQPIWPIRQRYMTYVIGMPGTATTGVAQTANVAASIRRVTDIIGKKGVGRVQIPATNAGYDDGLLLPDYIADDLAGLRDQIPLNVTTTHGEEWEPVLFSVNGGITSTSVVVDTEVEDTVRVMRRRTVRLGI